MRVVMLMEKDVYQLAGNLTLKFPGQFTGIDQFLCRGIARPRDVLHGPRLHPRH
jgi:hypothetical protein